MIIVFNFDTHQNIGHVLEYNDNLKKLTMFANCVLKHECAGEGLNKFTSYLGVTYHN
jgi:hypothetical protein